MKEQEHHPLSHHFLHPHRLKQTNTPPRPNTTCSGCKLTLIQGNYYHKCQTCPFSLHQICYNMPQIAHHRTDPKHIFTLQPTPSFPLNCNACSNNINSFYYNCPKCCDSYHILCLAAPLSVRSSSHPHILNLEFSPPYEFRCDICQKPSSQGWLYRCGLCEFDVHFACAISANGANLQRQQVPLPIDSANRRHELMELLTHGVKRVGERMDRKITETVQYGSNAGLEDRSLLSYQLSDACFSIDFAKSLLGNEMDHDGKGVKEEAKDLRHSSDTRGSNDGVNNNVNVRFENGIGSHIWRQVDPESEKKKYVSGGSNKKSDRSDNVRLGCSCWSKVLMRSELN